jgi:hypothetical protein
LEKLPIQQLASQVRSSAGLCTWPITLHYNVNDVPEVTRGMYADDTSILNVGENVAEL